MLRHVVICLPLRLMQTDIKMIRSQPNMCYAETPGKVFSRKSDYVNSIVRACARKFPRYIFSKIILETAAQLIFFAHQSVAQFFLSYIFILFGGQEILMLLTTFLLSFTCNFLLLK